MSSIFSQRSAGVEIMDDLDCKGEVVNQTLRELEFINRTLGGNQITVTGINDLLKDESQTDLEIVDLGCGGGDMLVLLAKEFSMKNRKARFLGVDANPNIIDYAQSHVQNFSNIEFETVNILSSEFQSKKFDIAIATLFFHHFTSEQLSNIIAKLHSQCRVGIVINDLHRHPLAFYSIKLLTKLFSKSTMVKFDAPLSVLRGFSRKEMIEILKNAGIKKYTLQWRWAFRWKVIIPRS
jgi:2-polyprenyl-3-methyl-5-hydroxy-6-metoxy-1,4-benzoquinol methylase